MRVVAGRFRGRKIIAPEGCGTRPILDRAKVALFDWLGSRLAQPGALPPIAVLDLFCGGGSLGIESLSRGVVFTTFVDEGAAAISALRTNLATLDITGAQATIIQDSVESAAIASPPTGKFDLIFLDPPYRLSADLESGSTMHRIWTRLDSAEYIAQGAWLIWRHEVGQKTPDHPASQWRCEDRRSWGHVAITAYRRAGAHEIHAEPQS